MRIILLLLAALTVPLVLTAIYVLALHGRAASPRFLHYVCLGFFVLSSVPFIALMPLGRLRRALIALVFIAGFAFTISDIGFWMCVQFGYPP